MKLNEITAFTAYRACTIGAAKPDTYYFQHGSGVVQIDRAKRLVSHLPRGYLVDYGVDVEEAEIEEYLEVASEVLLENGFPFLMSRS